MDQRVRAKVVVDGIVCTRKNMCNKQDSDAWWQGLNLQDKATRKGSMLSLLLRADVNVAENLSSNQGQGEVHIDNVSLIEAPVYFFELEGLIPDADSADSRL